MNIHNMMAHHPDLALAWMSFRYHIVPDSSYRGLSAYFDAKQLLEICCTVGMYMTLALIIKSFEVPLEEHLAGS